MKKIIFFSEKNLELSTHDTPAPVAPKKINKTKNSKLIKKSIHSMSK